MDIGMASMIMHQASLQTDVSISVLKLAMNSNTQIANQTTDIMQNMAVDSSRGVNLDVRV